jgi:regulator of ribonuclease activity A
MIPPDTPTADICDVFAARFTEGTLFTLPPVFPLRLGKPLSMHGPVVTVRAYEDNALVRQALEGGGDGHILVVDGDASTRRAMVGGNLGKIAEKNGWKGIVVYGCVRDTAELDECNIVIRAMASCPRATIKANTGEIGVSVEIGDVPISPGYWIYEDRDGIIVSASEL